MQEIADSEPRSDAIDDEEHGKTQNGSRRKANVEYKEDSDDDEEEEDADEDSDEESEKVDDWDSVSSTLKLGT